MFSIIYKPQYALIWSSVIAFFGGGVLIDSSSTGATLEVYGTDGNTHLRVEEDSATVDNNHSLLVLANNGHVRIVTNNNDEGGSWTLANRGVDFIINRNGSGVTEFDLDENTGNLTIAGTLTQNSDRNAKENFEAVDPQEILRKVAQLDITTWNFKREGGEIRHMGPMAQDFSALFGLGEHEDKISIVDVDGVALAAVKGLHDLLAEKMVEVDERDALIDRLLERDKEISNRLQDLERRMAETGAQ